MSTTDNKNLVYPHFCDPPSPDPYLEVPAYASVPASPCSAGSSKLIENMIFTRLLCYADTKLKMSSKICPDAALQSASYLRF